MFEIGDYVVYGSKGVCKVVDISDMDLGGSSRKYYFLEPVQDQGSKVYLPVDNQKAVIRPVMTREEALELIDEIPEVEKLQVPDERKREVSYKDAMRQCSSRVWVSIIKTLYNRKRERIAMGKKITALDEKYLRAAENELYGELSIALDVSQEDAQKCVDKYIERV